MRAQDVSNISSSLLIVALLPVENTQLRALVERLIAQKVSCPAVWLVNTAIMLTVELFREEHRAECLRIVSENYDGTMAINLDRELSDMFSNSWFPPKFLVLKEDGAVRGFGCWMSSRMEYGVYEVSWINVDDQHQGKGLGTFLVSRIAGLDPAI